MSIVKIPDLSSMNLDDLRALAQNYNTAPAILTKLVALNHELINSDIVLNENAPPNVLVKLSDSKFHRIRQGVRPACN